MNEKLSENQKKKEFSLLLSIIAVFCILGAIVFSVAQKLSNEMSASAIQSLSENLNLIKSTIEAILNNEAEFQNLIAREISSSDDPIEYVRSYEANKTMVKLSLVMAGETEGVSSKGEVFSEEELDFRRRNRERSAHLQILSESYGRLGIYHEMPHNEGRL